MTQVAITRRWWCMLVAVAVVGGTGLFAWAQNRSQPPKTLAKPPTPATADVEKLKLTGPYTHENLAVFLVHAEKRDDRDFITLNEGLKRGWVDVTEKKSAEVRELLIENRSDKPLYLQEGDRLVGGKQDRTLYASIAIPPKSGKMSIPTFCIERSRWTAGARGSKFGESFNAALAPKSVRSAAKVSKNQGRVWHEVAQLKALSSDQLGTANSNTSLNEALDSKEVTKLSKEFSAALGRAATKRPDSVGVAFAVNGKIEEVNIYPGHTLFAKVYPRLLESYAVEAALKKEPDRPQDAHVMFKPPQLADVRKFMTDARGKQVRRDDINKRNRLNVYQSADKAMCVTEYDGMILHQQWLREDAPSPSGRDAPDQQNGINDLQQRNSPLNPQAIPRRQLNRPPRNDNRSDADSNANTNEPDN